MDVKIVFKNKKILHVLDAYPNVDGTIHAIRLKPVGLLDKLRKRKSDVFQLFMIQPSSIDYVMVESTVEEEQPTEDKEVVHGVELYG